VTLAFVSLSPCLPVPLAACPFVMARALLRRCAVAALSPGPSASICSTRNGGNLETRASAQTSKFLIPIAACFEPGALYGRLLHSAAAVRFHLLEVYFPAWSRLRISVVASGCHYDFHSCSCSFILGWWPKTLVKRTKSGLRAVSVCGPACVWSPSPPSRIYQPRTRSEACAMAMRPNQGSILFR
jgi:hypothetical protein